MMKVVDDQGKLDTLIENMVQDWAKLTPERDGLDLAAAHIRLAYGMGYTVGLEERHQEGDE